MRFICLPLLFVALAWLTGCSDASPGAEAAAPEANATASDWLPLQLDGKRIEAQIVSQQSEMARGLMFRKELGADRGMLFVYGEPTRMSFYMKNTYIDLDIGFFDSDGVLREVYTMYAHDTSTTRSVSSQMQLALEMNAGWFARNGIRPGAQLNPELLAQALSDRGISAESYGIVSGE